jgi:MoaA/NifB/PqqE/SkfB family radical SAM enzyme
MRQLEHKLNRTRAVLRRAWSRLASVDPDIVAPARLVLQLDDRDLAGTMGTGEELTLQEWNQTIAQVIEWLGPVPVTVIATRNTTDALVPELIRFAHRLECPTTLVTDGTGIDVDKAVELLASGLSSIRVLVGGVSDEVQQRTVGNDAAAATGAVAAMLSARRDTELDIDIEVIIPWVEGVTEELNAIVGWARQAGADGFRLTAPYRAASLPADPELLDEIVDSSEGFCRNTSVNLEELHAMVAHQDGAPGLSRSHSRRRFKCSVGGERLVIGRRRSVYSCPFHAPIVELDVDFASAWAQAGTHLECIATCTRACVHAELAPQPILG